MEFFFFKFGVRQFVPETIDIPILVKRCRGRQQARWEASCNRDIESVGLRCRRQQARWKASCNRDIESVGLRCRGRQQARWKASCNRDIESVGLRCRGRQQARWKASCNRDIESVGLKVDDTMDTREWKGIVLNYSVHPR